MTRRTWAPAPTSSRGTRADGSDIVEGQNGVDTLDFNGAGIALENMFLTPNGSRSLFHRDQGNINMDMDGVERLDLDALGGVDTIRVDDMSGTDFRRADIDLGGADGAVDVLTVNGTANDDRVRVVTDGASVSVKGLKPLTRITDSEVTDKLQINTLAAAEVQHRRLTDRRLSPRRGALAPASETVSPKQPACALAINAPTNRCWHLARF